MKKTITIIFLMVCLVLLYGCMSRSEQNEEFHPYQKMIQLEADLKTPNPNWVEIIKEQLINIYGFSNQDSEKIIQDSHFERWQLEYASIQDYDGEQYPYCFKANLVIWKSESNYAICSIDNKTTEPCVHFRSIEVD